jgi:Zn-finger nucleic acid-binding protein
MECPRDGRELIVENTHGIEVDRCPQCNGRWLDYNELDQLEATTGATESERRATIEFGEKPSELDCPKCGKRMKAFNYRAYDLELDTCPEEHGYWLDSGEEGRVRDIINDRVRGLERSASAEASWGGFLRGIKGGRGRGGGGGFFGRR